MGKFTVLWLDNVAIAWICMKIYTLCKYNYYPVKIIIGGQIYGLSSGLFLKSVWAGGHFSLLALACHNINGPGINGPGGPFMTA